jgi:hypothetical protein
MPELSRSEQEWNDRASDLNYRCRVCRQQITFSDQKLYFTKGMCAPCLSASDAERTDPNSATQKRLADIRSRGASRSAKVEPIETAPAAEKD